MDASKWTVPPVFGWIASSGGIGESEMARTFNCGLGGVMVVAERDVNAVIQMVGNGGEPAFDIGRVVGAEQGEITYEG